MYSQNLAMLFQMKIQNQINQMLQFQNVYKAFDSEEININDSILLQNNLWFQSA